MDAWYEGGWFKQTPRTRFQADYVSIAQSSSVWLYRATQPSPPALPCLASPVPVSDLNINTFMDPNISHDFK